MRTNDRLDDIKAELSVSADQRCLNVGDVRWLVNEVSGLREQERRNAGILESLEAEGVRREAAMQREAAARDGWNKAAVERDQARATVYKLRLFLSEFLQEYDSAYYDSEPNFWDLADKARVLLKETV